MEEKIKIHYRIRSNGGYDEGILIVLLVLLLGKCNSAVFARTEIVGEDAGYDPFFGSEMGSSGRA